MLLYQWIPDKVTYIHMSNPLLPGYANDGVNDQSPKNGFLKCSHTMKNEPKYWWAVDLGRSYKIGSITIYNRIDCCAERLYNYSIFVFNSAISTWETFSADYGVLCYFHPGQSPNITNLTCNKKTKGRYVQIYKEFRSLDINDALALCQVLVFVSITDVAQHFCKEMTKRPIKHIHSFLIISKILCAKTCLTFGNCLGFRFQTDNGCDLYQTSMTVDTVDNDLNYYEKC